jgi:hypothetical protein
VEVYNNERPHQALNGRYPGDLYTPSTRVYRPPEEPNYPYHDRSIRVTQCGRICIGKRKINLSTVFAGETVGIREVDDKCIFWPIPITRTGLNRSSILEHSDHPFWFYSITFTGFPESVIGIQNG